MAPAYFEDHFEALATFELFVRSLADSRGYLLFAGLEQALDFLEQVRFKPEEVGFVDCRCATVTFKRQTGILFK